MSLQNLFINIFCFIVYVFVQTKHINGQSTLDQVNSINKITNTTKNKQGDYIQKVKISDDEFIMGLKRKITAYYNPDTAIVILVEEIQEGGYIGKESYYFDNDTLIYLESLQTTPNKDINIQQAYFVAGELIMAYKKYKHSADKRDIDEIPNLADDDILSNKYKYQSMYKYRVRGALDALKEDDE